MAKKTVSLSMERVQRQFLSWRRKRDHREKIPEALWAKAVKLARRRGVGPVSRALRLEHNKLKRLATPRSGVKVSEQAPALPVFVEWRPSSPTTTGVPAEYFVEMENPRGKMRIRIKSPVEVNLEGLTRGFWG